MWSQSKLGFLGIVVFTAGALGCENREVVDERFDAAATAPKAPMGHPMYQPPDTLQPPPADSRATDTSDGLNQSTSGIGGGAGLGGTSGIPGGAATTENRPGGSERDAANAPLREPDTTYRPRERVDVEGSYDNDYRYRDRDVRIRIEDRDRDDRRDRDRNENDADNSQPNPRPHDPDNNGGANDSPNDRPGPANTRPATDNQPSTGP